MNNHFFQLASILLSAVLVLSACDSADDPAVEETLQTAANGKYITFGMPETRSVVSAREAFDYITFALFSGSNKVAEVRQDAEMDGFGRISMFVPYGKYTVVAIGNKGQGHATIENPEKVTFAGDKLGDTFSFTTTITVDASSDSSYDYTLVRDVALFQLKVTDNCPDNIGAFRFQVKGAGKVLNPQELCAVAAAEQTITVDVPSTYRGKPIALNVYLLLPDQTASVDFVISALATDGTVLNTLPFSGVEMRRNHISGRTVSFFGTEFSGGLNADTTWE